MIELAHAVGEYVGTGEELVQVRGAAALEDLRTATAPSRHALIDEHLARLEASIAAAHPVGSPDLAPARIADRTGIGLRR